MTIFRPKKKNKCLFFFAFLTILVIIGGVLYISQYNSVADKRFQVKNIKEELVQAGVKNAEIKNKLYKNINFSKLESMAGDYNLVLEKNPNYMNINQWVSDSSF